MTNNSPFDDHIKKQFGNYKPEVPPHIWENIIAQKEQKKPGGFLFSMRRKGLTLILILLIAGGAGALLLNNIYKDNSGKQSSLDKKSRRASTIAQEKNSIPGEAKKAEEKNSGHKRYSSSLQSPQQKVNTANHDAVKSSNEDHRVSTVPPSVEERASSAANNLKTDYPRNALTKKKHVFIPKKTGGKDENQTGINVRAVTSDEEISTKISPSKHTTKKLTGRSASSLQIPPIEVIPAMDDNGVVETITGSMADEALIKNRYLDLQTISAEKTFAFSVKNSNIPSFNIPCPKGQNEHRKKYFEIYGGPDYAFRSFNDTANSAYLKKRKESTSVNAAFSIGLRYTRVFSNGLSFRTGLNYSQVNEKFKFEQGHIVQVAYIVNDNGDTTGGYATTGTRYKVTHNKYRTIDIPLLIGYETGTGRLRTNFNTGFVVNAYSWQKGDLLDSTFQPVNITTGKSNSAYQFKTNVGLGVTGGISFYYRLAGGMHILAEPYFRYNFSAANKADITLKQKYTTIGLRLGLRIDF